VKNLGDNERGEIEDGTREMLVVERDEDVRSVLDER
jgi:hypothetical protein